MTTTGERFGERHVVCWICDRRIQRSEASFVQLEDDGCGEYECTDRAKCYRAHGENQARGRRVVARESTWGAC